MIQQSHSVSPQSQPKHGFLTAFTPPLIEDDDEEEDVGRVLFTGSVSSEAPIAMSLASSQSANRYQERARPKKYIVELAEGQ
jgi:hypothetical protein